MILNFMILPEDMEMLKNFLENLIKSMKEKQKLYQMSKNIDYIKFNKWTKNLKIFFNNANLFVLPSLYEGSPNILLDVINNNVPVLSSDCSGVKDILKDNNKFIFKINDLNQLKKKNHIHNFKL